jgi:LysR family transcriptional activator of nhaA
MNWLNYHHLRYFWAVVKEGSIARASQVLHVSQPSISTQLRLLERSLGEQLLKKQGRGLVPTEMGRLVQVYAEQIFTLGRELLDAVADRPTGQPLRLQVGIADVLPKHLALRLLEPALCLETPVRIFVREGRPERLLAELQTYALDLVVTDQQLPVAGPKRVFHHALGRTEIAVFGTKKLAQRVAEGFPASLQDQPFLLPHEDSQLRREVETWLREQSLRLRIVGEFEDTALLQTFARKGLGLMLAPAVLAHDLEIDYGLRRCGTLDGLHETYYVLSVERKVRHPAVAAILQNARQAIFEPR